METNNSYQKRKKFVYIMTVIINVILVVALMATLYTYSSETDKWQFQSKKDELVAMNDSISKQVQIYFSSQYKRLLDKKKYIENSELSTAEAAEYVYNSNDDNSLIYQFVSLEGVRNAAYERVVYDYQTFSVVPQHGIVNGSYNSLLTPVFRTIEGIKTLLAKNESVDESVINSTGLFTLPFTYRANESANGLRVRPQALALYTTVRIVPENVDYVFLLCVAAEDFLVGGMPKVNYDKSDNAIIDASGSYISKTNEWFNDSNTDLWAYFFSVYGNYEKAYEIRDVLNGNNSCIFDETLTVGVVPNQVDAVLVYSTLENTNNWKYISIVPTNELKQSTTDWMFVLIFIAFILLLVLFNGIVVISLARYLRRSLVDVSNAMERAEHANKAKSSFLSRMSHEIRTPLNAVIGYMTIAKANVDNSQKIQDCISKTEISAKHLLNVVNDILDISAIESGKIVILDDIFDLRNLVVTLSTIFSTMSEERGVCFNVNIESEVEERIIGDQMRINQILINLLNNAIKFTPEGGSVTFTITQHNVDEKNMKLKFVVEDTGIGMSEEFLGRIWKPFEQADSGISRKYGGSGLGLMITKTLVEMMKGEIFVETQQGKGSIFTVVLPLCRTINEIDIKEYDMTSIRALIVDDDQSVCDYVKLLMNRFNIRCAAACSGEDAIQFVMQAEASGDAFNFCMIDMRMPDQTGLQTAERIMQLSKTKVNICVLSSYDMTPYIEEGKRIGIFRFLQKPLFQSTLFDTLTQICAQTVKAVESVPDKSINGLKVLLVEDNEMNLDIAKDLLEMVGAVVDCATNGKIAVEKFIKSEKGTYDVILMDVQMPVMDGYTATREIRASSHPDAQSIVIISMTANVFESDIRDAYQAGMNEHIAKPIDTKRLFVLLQKIKSQK